MITLFFFVSDMFSQQAFSTIYYGEEVFYGLSKISRTRKEIKIKK